MTDRLRVREIDDDEGRRLVRIVRRGSGSVVTWRRAQMVLLSAQGMDATAIAKVAFTSEDRVRDVIRNFNADGFGSLYPKYKGGRPPKFTLPQRREVKKIAKAKPAEYDLPFSTWSLAKLADFLVAEGVVDDISHEGLRVLLREEGVTFQRLKTWKTSKDPCYQQKKARVEQLYAIAVTYLPACSHTSVRANRGRSDSSSRLRSPSAVPAPILTAAAALDSVVCTNNGIDGRLPLMPQMSDTRRPTGQDPKCGCRTRGKITIAGGIERAVTAEALRVSGRGGVLVLLDADDDCPAQCGPRLLARAEGVRPDKQVSVVLANREFEGWFLAAAPSLAGQFGFSANFSWPKSPETPRDCKGLLTKARPKGQPYKETVDQASLASAFDLKMAREYSDSFDKFYREVCRLLGTPFDGGSS